MFDSFSFSINLDGIWVECDDRCCVCVVYVFSCTRARTANNMWNFEWNLYVYCECSYFINQVLLYHFLFLRGGSVDTQSWALYCSFVFLLLNSWLAIIFSITKYTLTLLADHLVVVYYYLLCVASTLVRLFTGVLTLYFASLFGV
jgi:hypothetical protein